MKPDTIVKRLRTIVDEGIIPLSDEVKKEGVEDNIELCAEVVEHLTDAGKLLSRLEKLRPVKEGPKRPGRINNQSLRVFRRDGYACQVCGLKDTNCKNLSSAKLVMDIQDDSDLTTLCKTHMKELKTLKPWKTRTDRESTYRVLIDMAQRYSDGDTSFEK
jgi:hypothetical protein